MPEFTPKWEETQPLQDVPRFEDTQPLDAPSFDQTSDPTVKDEIRAAIPEIVNQIRQAVVAPPQMGEFTPEQIQSTVPPVPGPMQAAAGVVSQQIGSVAPNLPGPEMLQQAGRLVYNPEDPLGVKGMAELGQAARLKGSGVQISPEENKALEDFTVENFKGIVLYPAAITGAAQAVGWYLANKTLPGAVRSAREAVAKGLRANGMPAEQASRMADEGMTQAVAKAQAAGAEPGIPEFVALRKSAERGFGPKEGTPNVPATTEPISAAAPDTNIQALSARLDQPIPKFEETQPVEATKSKVQSDLREEELARRSETAAQALQERPTAPVEGWRQEPVAGGGTSLESPSGYRVFVPEGQDPQRAAAAIREIERAEYGESQIPETTLAKVKKSEAKARYEQVGEVEKKKREALLSAASKKYEEMRITEGEDAARKYYDEQDASSFVEFSKARQKAEEEYRKLEAIGWEPETSAEVVKKQELTSRWEPEDYMHGARYVFEKGGERVGDSLFSVQKLPEGRNTFPDFPELMGKKVGYSGLVGVEDKFKGQGLGSEIVKKLEAEAKKQGAEYFAFIDVLSSAAPFYKKQGYVISKDGKMAVKKLKQPPAPVAEAPATVEAPAPQKQPWEMTKEEYLESRKSEVPDFSGFEPDIQAEQIKSWSAEYQPGSWPREANVPASVLRELPEAQRAQVLKFNDKARQVWADAQAPWNQTYKQFLRGTKKAGVTTGSVRELHKSSVERALSEGKPVPPEVLKDYPGLQAPPSSTAPAKTSPERNILILSKPEKLGLIKTNWSLTRKIDGRTESSGFSSEKEAIDWAKKYGWEVEVKGKSSPSGGTPAKTAPAKAPLTPIEEAIKSFDFPADSQVNKNLRLYHVVDLFKKMEGGVPEVVKTFRRKGGVLGTASSEGKIKLRAALGLNENISSLVLAHEISHVADAIYGDTTRTYARGNILGRIGAMDRYVYDNLAATLKTKEEMTAAQPEVKAIREPFLELARKQADVENLKGPARARFIKDKIRELSDPKLREAGFVSQSAVSKELTELARWWNQDERMKPTGVELYAEGMSVYLLSPKDVAKRAPIFYDLTKNWLQKKPEFEQLVNEFWATLEQSPEVAQDKVLDDLTANFQKNRETKAAVEDKVMAAKKDVAPLDWLAMKLNYTIPLTNKMGRMGLQPWDTPFNEIQMWKHHAPVTEKYLRHINDTIREAILGTKNLTEDMVGIQLALNRIAYGDRSELLNTLGITEKSAPEIAARLKERAGNEYDKLNEVVERVYDAHEEILKGADGVLNANGLKKLRDNRYYATFSLNKFIEESVGGNGEISKLIHPQVGSLEAIGNPLEALIDKDVRMQYTFLRSKAFEAFYQWGIKLNDGTVLPVERVKGGNIKGAPPGYKTLYWLWDSKVKAMHVKDGYYQIFSQDHSEAARHTNVLESALKFFKYAFVNLNPAFFVTNPIRDSFFTAQNLKELPFFSMDLRYKFGALESLARTMKEIPGAWRHQIGKETSAAIQELKEMGVGQSEYNRDMGELSQGLERMLRSNGVFTRTAKFSSPGQALLRAMEIALDAGRASDLASKAAALKLLKEKHPDADPAWLAHVLRTRAGTPDTTNRGAMTGVYNWVWMYSQVAFEGWRGNYASAKENPGAFTAKLFGQSVLPRLLILAAGAGLIGKDDEEKKRLQKVVNGIPEWFKAGSLVVPVGLDKNGKSVFITLPQDELSRTAGGVAYFMVKNMAEASRDSLLKDVMESMKMAVDYGQTQAPGLNPLIQLGFQAGALADLPKGEGPKDSFGRPMISARYRAEYQNQKGRALTEYLKNVWNFAGLTTIYKFKPGAEEVQSELESLLRIPIAGAMASRFIRVSSSGASNKPYEAKAEVEAERATVSNDRIDAMLEFRKDFMDKNKGKEPAKSDVREFYFRLKKESPEMVKGSSVGKFRRSYTNYTIASQGGSAKAFAALKSGSAEGKAAALKEIEKTMKPAEFNDFKKWGKIDGLISRKTMREFRRLP